MSENLALSIYELRNLCARTFKVCRLPKVERSMVMMCHLSRHENPTCREELTHPEFAISSTAYDQLRTASACDLIEWCCSALTDVVLGAAIPVVLCRITNAVAAGQRSV